MNVRVVSVDCLVGWLVDRLTGCVCFEIIQGCCARDLGRLIVWIVSYICPLLHSRRRTIFLLEALQDPRMHSGTIPFRTDNKNMSVTPRTMRLSNLLERTFSPSHATISPKETWLQMQYRGSLGSTSNSTNPPAAGVGLFIYTVSKRFPCSKRYSCFCTFSGKLDRGIVYVGLELGVK